MATNPSTLPENSGRITAPDANYPYGSAKDDSTGTTGDGTPIKKALLNDTYGLFQAILQAAGITPSGNAETALVSQLLKGIVEQAQGRAKTYNEDLTSVADAYVLALRTNQQGAGSLFDGQEFAFYPANANTGATTIDVSAAIGQAVGTTIRSIVTVGATALKAGDIPANKFTVIRFDSANNRFVLVSTENIFEQKIISSTGYQRFPSGLMIQWGTVVLSTVSASYSFPTTFPNQAFRVLITDGGVATVEYAAAEPVDASQFNARANSGTPGCSFLAIGW